MPSIDMPLEQLRQYKPPLYRQADFESFWESTTAEALKQKAAQLGQIKEMTEDPQSGSMTIVLEV